jgi:hypothetical protein
MAVTRTYSYVTVVDKFDPNIHRISEWLLQYESAATANNWNGQEKIRRLIGFLDYDGCELLRGLLEKNPNLTWDEAVEKLKIFLGPEPDRWADLIEVQARKWEDGERFEKYWMVKQRMIDRLNPVPSEEEQVALFVQGLPAQYRNLIDVRQVENVEVLFNNLRNIVRFQPPGNRVSVIPTELINAQFRLQDRGMEPDMAAMALPAQVHGGPNRAQQNLARGNFINNQNPQQQQYMIDQHLAQRAGQNENFTSSQAQNISANSQIPGTSASNLGYYQGQSKSQATFSSPQKSSLLPQNTSRKETSSSCESDVQMIQRNYESQPLTAEQLEIKRLTEQVRKLTMQQEKQHEEKRYDNKNYDHKNYTPARKSFRNNKSPNDKNYNSYRKNTSNNFKQNNYKQQQAPPANYSAPNYSSYPNYQPPPFHQQYGAPTPVATTYHQPPVAQPPPVPYPVNYSVPTQQPPNGYSAPMQQPLNAYSAPPYQPNGYAAPA